MPVLKRYNEVLEDWEEVDASSLGTIDECPDDGKIYVRRFGAWEELQLT